MRDVEVALLAQNQGFDPPHRATGFTAELLHLGLHDRAHDTIAVQLQYVKAIRDDGPQHIHVDDGPAGCELRARRSAAHIGEPEYLHRTNVEPADVEFPPLVRKLRGRAVRMVVVVQLLAADQQSDGYDVAGRILRLEIAVPPIVADAVDNACRPERDPDHLHDEDDCTSGAEEQQIDDEHAPDADEAMLRVHVALEPIVTCPGTECFEH